MAKEIGRNLHCNKTSKIITIVKEKKLFLFLLKNIYAYQTDCGSIVYHLHYRMALGTVNETLSTISSVKCSCNCEFVDKYLFTFATSSQELNYLCSAAREGEASAERQASKM